MEHLGVIEVAESSKQFFHCESCDYTTSRRCNYVKHLSTGKHIKLTNASSGKQECACGKLFNHKQSLFRHKKTCELVINPTAKVAKVAGLLPNNISANAGLPSHVTSCVKRVFKKDSS